MRKILLFLLLPLLTLTVQAIEHIHEYHSHIEVLANADLIITETITVQAEGKEIRRGIYRDFPTDYKDRHGNRYVVDFEILDILRDGKQEAYHTERKDNGTRVYVGKSNVYLDNGIYTYTLKYRTNYQIGYFESHDELYFNAIGTGWVFPISQASVTVELPATIPDMEIKAEGYTGPQGAQDRNLRVVSTANSTVAFEITQQLNPNEGATVVVMWSKGHVKEPSEREKAARLLKVNRGIFIALIGAILVSAYFVIAWLMVGKDPEKGVIIPEYEPPLNLSPAGARFLMNMKYDHRCFACALINMAVKGRITLEENGKKYTVLNNQDARVDISKGEAKVYKALLGSRKSIKMEQSNHRRIGNAVKALKAVLKSEFEGKSFNRNIGWLVPGFIGTALTLGATFLLGGKPEGLFLGFWLSFWSFGVYFLVRQVWTTWTNPGRGVGETLGAIFITLFAIPFVGAEIVVGGLLTTMLPPYALILLVLLLGENVLFYHLMKQPTHLGRKLMDKLEGFKLYLSVAEDESFDAMKGPEKTPELFEAYLPYALALGVEQEWSEKFSSILAQAGQTPSESGYRPMWHHSNASHFDTAAFAGGLGGALSSAIASSSTAPGSSSGGGGGGFSGGGGGGGGGGGW